MTYRCLKQAISSGLLLFASIGLFLTDCTEGGQTGDEDGVPRRSPWVDNPPGGSPGGCLACGVQEDAELLSIDEATPLGVTAREILAFAEGNFQAELCWKESFDKYECDDLSESGLSCAIQITPKIDNEVITVSIEYDGGEIRYREPEGLDFCEGILEIDVRLKLSTNGGGFEERIDTALRVQGPYEASASVQLWDRELKNQLEQEFGLAHDLAFSLAYNRTTISPTVHILQGDLAVTADDSDEIVLDLVEVELSVSELGLRGSMSAYFSDRSEETFRIEDIASFGSFCRDGCFAIDADQPIPGDGITAQSVVDLLNDVGEIEAVSDEGSKANLTLDFNYIDDSACADMSVGYVGDPWEGNSLSLNTMMSIASEGLIDADWTVNVDVITDGFGEIESVRVRFDPRFDPQLKATRTRWGLLGIDLGDYDRVSIYLDLELTPSEQASEATWEGEITVVVSEQDVDSSIEEKIDFEGMDADDAPDAGDSDPFESETILLRLRIAPSDFSFSA